MSSKKEKIQKDKQSMSEQAINHRESDDVNLNQQVRQKREKHQPRDKA